MTLPNFASPSIEDLRSYWVAYRGNQDVQRLILETRRLQQAMTEVESLYTSIQAAWSDENLGHLVALYKLRLLVLEERSRHGSLRGLGKP